MMHLLLRGFSSNMIFDIGKAMRNGDEQSLGGDGPADISDTNVFSCYSITAWV